MKELTPAQKTSIWTKLGAMVGLSEVQVKLAKYEAKDGTGIEINDETKEVQGEVADGEYELADGQILVIAEGKLAEVKPAPEAETTEAAEETQPESTEAAPDEKDATISALEAKVAELEAALAEATQGKAELATQLSALESKPVDAKTNLSAQYNPVAKTPAQAAWERYNASK